MADQTRRAEREERFIFTFTSPPGASKAFVEVLEALARDYGRTLAIAYESALPGDACSLVLADAGLRVEEVRWTGGSAPTRPRLIAMLERRRGTPGEDDDCAGGACAL